MIFTVAELNEWYANLEDGGYGNQPEGRLPEDYQTPFGKFEIVTEGRDRDNPSIWQYIIKIGDRYFEQDGYYSSWDGVEFENDTWYEVELKTRTEEYWSEV